MSSKPDNAKTQPNIWTCGGQAKSSDVAATTKKFLADEAAKQRKAK
jgi:hypothetical protein